VYRKFYLKIECIHVFNIMERAHDVVIIVISPAVLVLTVSHESAFGVLSRMRERTIGLEG
jgi:hypothetical protein